MVWRPLKVSHHPSEFDGHSPCGSGDIMPLYFLVISQDHVMKKLCDFMGRSPSSKLPFCNVWWPQPLRQWSYNDFSLSHVLSRPRDQRVMSFYGQKPLTVSHYPAKFGGHKHCGHGDLFLVAEEDYFRCSCFNLPLLFIVKGHDSIAHGKSY